QIAAQPHGHLGLRKHQLAGIAGEVEHQPGGAHWDVEHHVSGGENGSAALDSGREVGRVQVEFYSVETAVERTIEVILPCAGYFDPVGGAGADDLVVPAHLDLRL